jgi:hypothetical protein
LSPASLTGLERFDETKSPSILKETQLFARLPVLLRSSAGGAGLSGSSWAASHRACCDSRRHTRSQALRAA